MTKPKRETARVFGFLIFLVAVTTAVTLGPNLAIAAERGRAPGVAPLIVYCTAAVVAVAGLGLVFLQRWAGATLGTLSIVSVVAHLAVVAANASLPVFLLNVFAAPFLLIPAAVVWWTWPALQGRSRQAAPD